MNWSDWIEFKSRHPQTRKSDIVCMKLSDIQAFGTWDDNPKYTSIKYSRYKECGEIYDTYIVYLPYETVKKMIFDAGYKDRFKEEVNK